MSDAKIFPSSDFKRLKRPPVPDDFGPVSRYELFSVPVRSNVPDFGMVAWRMLEASERLTEFHKVLPEVMKDWTGHMEARAPFASPEDIEIRLMNWQWNHLPSARRLTFVTSEIVHHVRVCLDYCAYNSVWIAKGQPKSHTKFPLVTDAAKWNQERKKGIPGVKAHHREWVEEVQPYNGIDWTKYLVDLSNQDKHRTAVELIPLFKAQLDPKKLFSDPAGNPRYRGFEVENPRIEMRIVPAMDPADDGPPGVSAGKILLDLVVGGVELVNKFITEAGYAPLEIVQNDGRP